MGLRMIWDDVNGRWWSPGETHWDPILKCWSHEIKDESPTGGFFDGVVWVNGVPKYKATGKPFLEGKHMDDDIKAMWGIP